MERLKNRVRQAEAFKFPSLVQLNDAPNFWFLTRDTIRLRVHYFYKSQVTKCPLAMTGLCVDWSILPTSTTRIMVAWLGLIFEQQLHDKKIGYWLKDMKKYALESYSDTCAILPPCLPQH